MTSRDAGALLAAGQGVETCATTGGPARPNAEQYATPSLPPPMAGLSVTRMLLYSAGSVGTGAFYAFNNFVLPPVLQALGASNLLIGLLSSTRSIEGALIQPTIGAWSDRVWSPFGRRRPFLVVAIPLAAVFFLLAAAVHSLAPLAVAIILFSIFFNVAADPYAALLADTAPLHQRGLLSGLSTAVQLISQVGFLLLVASASAGGNVPAWAYGLVATILVVGFGVTVVGVPERRGGAVEHQRLPLRTYLAALLVERQAVRYLLTIFVYTLGLNAILPYLVLFITDDIHASEQTAFVLSAVLMLVMAVSATVFGKLADRIGAKRVLVFGWTILAVCAGGGVLVRTVPQTVVVVLLAGLGNGAATAVTWPLLTMLIPHEKTGVFAGLKAAAESVAIPLSVVVAAEIFLPTFGYRGIFAMLAL
ncbi:MAG TPA: MFS transporter, partial [Chloroflexota bacterium]|nr:MFS transporter [Chloroflexota bacterium]